MLFPAAFLVGLVSYSLPVLAGKGCPAKYAPVASILENYPPAESYCSAHYPLELVTTTVSAPAITGTGTVTVTTTSTAGAVTVTAIVPTTSTITSMVSVTATSTSTTATTVTTTTTVIVPPSSMKRLGRSVAEKVDKAVKRGSGHPSKSSSTAAGNPRQSAWSSIMSVESSIIGHVCTCIETASTRTVTVTPTATATSTSTITSTVTPTTTVTVTSATTVTTPVTTTITTMTTTTTSTSTVTVSTTTRPAQIACSAQQTSFCTNSGGFTSGALPCTACGILYNGDTAKCWGQGPFNIQCRGNDVCLENYGASAECFFDADNPGSTYCAISGGCNST